MKSFPVNLASEPLEKVRAARRTLALVGAAVLLVSIVHLTWWAWMSRPSPADESSVTPLFDAATLAEWSREVDRLAAASEQDRARGAATAVRLGNQLIAWRTIPWRALFADLEEVLPQRVRLEIVAPAIDEAGSVRVQMTAVAGDPGLLQDLLIAMEAHGAFRQVWPEREEVGVEGESRMILRAYHEPASDPATAAEASDAGTGREESR